VDVVHAVEAEMCFRIVERRRLGQFCSRIIFRTDADELFQ
jgi:hypothetical protein